MRGTILLIFRYLRFLKEYSAFPLILFISINILHAQNKPCPFDEKNLQFAGTPLEQARCLLRPNKIYGVLGAELTSLPKPLDVIVGERATISKEKLRNYILSHSLKEQSLGGSLDESLALSKLPNGASIQTLYFIIHDTSSPYLKDESFQSNFDTDPKAKGNNLEVWLNQPVAHTFVNRLGDSLTTTPFGEPVRKGWGTKFARDYLKADGKGLEIHIELIQPRRREPSGSQTNDAIAPVPGFTDAQYERLALLYVCASVRRGSWLIPAYHSAIDAGIKDAHDDPQNFDLNLFASKLSRLIKKLK